MMTKSRVQPLSWLPNSEGRFEEVRKLRLVVICCVDVKQSSGRISRFRIENSETRHNVFIARECWEITRQSSLQQQELVEQSRRKKWFAYGIFEACSFGLNRKEGLETGRK